MSVRVESGAAWRASTPAAVIKGQYYNGVLGRTYDVSLDAKRFLMIKPDPAERITLASSAPAAPAGPTE